LTLIVPPDSFVDTEIIIGGQVDERLCPRPSFPDLSSGDYLFFQDASAGDSSGTQRFCERRANVADKY
jgi:hypothetical protein